MSFFVGLYVGILAVMLIFGGYYFVKLSTEVNDAQIKASQATISNRQSAPLAVPAPSASNSGYPSTSTGIPMFNLSSFLKPQQR
jgi:hypothetical protein